jgi:hypothetical protein
MPAMAHPIKDLLALASGLVPIIGLALTGWGFYLVSIEYFVGAAGTHVVLFGRVFGSFNLGLTAIFCGLILALASIWRDFSADERKR